MEIVIGIVGSIAAVFVVIFGGRGLVDLARGMRERRSQPSASWGLGGRLLTANILCD